MDIATLETQAEAALKKQIGALDLADVPDALMAHKRVAAEEFSRAGLPHRRVEAWRYTDLRARMKTALPLATKADAEAVACDDRDDVFADIAGARLVVTNGVFRPELSSLERLPAGVEVIPFAKAGLGETAWAVSALGSALTNGGGTIGALNTVFACDGVVIRVAEGVQTTEPLHLIFVNHGEVASHARNLVMLGKGASLRLIESHQGQGAYQATNVAEVLLGEDAKLDHVKLVVDGPDAQNLSLLAARLADGADLKSFLMGSGAKLFRAETTALFDGEGANADLGGCMLLAGKQHGDATIFVDHAVPACTSRELYKVVLDDEAHGVFQGQILVRPHAQKTDGRQSSNALLLSENAEMSAKPQLEIYADDVQCAHGSTAGQIDEDLLFYLRARGIPEKEARALLVLAFIGAALEEVPDEDVRAVLQKHAEDWLYHRRS